MAVDAPAAPASTVAVDGRAWAAMIERLARNLERGSKQWTPARRKDSLQRVLDGSRSDAARMLQRLQSLVTAWEGDRPGEVTEVGSLDPVVPSVPASALALATLAATNTVIAPAEPGAPAATGAVAAGLGEWPPLVASLEQTVRAGLPAHDARAVALADELASRAAAVARDGATPAHVVSIDALCEAARSLFAHRNRLVDELAALCRQMADGIVDLAEDDSWARGQAAGLRDSLSAEGGTEPSVRSVRAAGAILADTRQRQQRVRAERQAARETIKVLIQRVIGDAGEIGDEAGRFQQAVGRHAEAVARADSLESLGTVVRAILDDSQAVQSAVKRTRDRLEQDRSQAEALQDKVRALEAELRRLSDEVATDALTQVANRRGLSTAFDTERARCERDAAVGAATALSVALIDIDNFKKLNDTLGHAAGDIALKSLAAGVRERLRPIDHLARFGGEEFVVLLPGTTAAEAKVALSRLQRNLSAALFMHEGRDVLVTFSAGVTQWRAGEVLQTALERADQALYEAKRTGKNRTCAA